MLRLIERSRHYRDFLRDFWLKNLNKLRNLNREKSFNKLTLNQDLEKNPRLLVNLDKSQSPSRLLNCRDKLFETVETILLTVSRSRQIETPRLTNNSLIPNVHLIIIIFSLILSVYLSPRVIALSLFHCFTFKEVKF